jgi:ferric enterobactin receptor
MYWSSLTDLNFTVMNYRLPLLTIFILFIASTGFARDFVLSGRVVDDTDNPVLFATVYTKDLSRHTLSDEDGQFKLSVPGGTTTIVVSSMGYVAIERELFVDKDQTDILFRLKRVTLSLDEVVVSARVTESRAGTSVYEIGQQAIQQVQAMHLGDVLSLLPGGRVTPADLTSVQQANLRTAAGSNVNNFGTAVIIDDAVISNDANMQAINPTSNFEAGPSSVAAGVDLRSITAANIESVEVITGVASPRHGNITSGAILVQSRVGHSPLTVSANMTPVAYQFSANQGFRLGRQRGHLNADISYTYSDNNPVDRQFFYNNISAGLRWRKRISRELDWSNTASFQYVNSYNGRRFEPEEVFLRTRKIRNNAFSFSNRGTMDLLGKLSYTLGARVEDQFSRFKSVETDGPLPLASGLFTGTYFTTYSPAVYDLETEIRGLPVNLNGRLEADQHLSLGQYMFSFITGTQYSYDRNLGSGRVVTGNVATPTGSSASRAIRFHELPASTALSFYHESDIRRVGENSRYRLRLGGRYDYMDQRYHLFSPRLSFNAQYIDKLRFRAAYGISYKAPALIQLYPGPTYHDYSNLSFFATNPLERMAIVSTYVYQPSNDHLKPSRGDTWEFGVDWESDNLRIRTTAFRKELKDGILHSPELIILERQLYGVMERPANRPPVVTPIAGGIDRLPRRNQVLKNVFDSTTDGFEIVLSPPKIDITNTEFDFRFSHMKTTENNRGYRLELERLTAGATQGRFGVYEHPERISYLTQGNLTVIQHIPALQLVFTFIIELNVQDYTETIEPNLYPYAYYDFDGSFFKIPEERRMDPEYENMRLPDFTYTIYDIPPFHTNYHLQIRKETRTGHSFSFYANNAFWYNPEYIYNGFRRTHNSSISFGFGVSFKIEN